MSDNTIRLHYNIPSRDLTIAGEASSNVKKMLNHLGVNPLLIKKAAVAMYEAEINAVIHAYGGIADVEIDQNKIVIKIQDEGPGIPDIDLAMQEGFTTATDNIREMGFGAGMGLPNIKRYADNLEIITKVNEGTTVIITVYFDDKVQA